MAVPADRQRETALAVPDAAVDNAVQLLHERLDVLLDRLTDSLMGTPTPGSVTWRARFDTSGALTRAVRAESRAAVRGMIAARAGVTDPAAPGVPAAPAVPGSSRRHSLPERAPRRRAPRLDPAQLAMF